MNQWIVTSDNSCQEWQEIYKIAVGDKEHMLWENYQKIDLDTYEHMVVNIRDGIPAAFHGVFNHGRWPNNFSRICNRAYINPHFRNLGQGLEITSTNIKFALDNYSRWGKDVLFITRGVQYDNVEVSWRKFEKFVKFLKLTTSYTDLTYDDKLYKCCGSGCKDCYQFAVWYNPKNIEITVDSITQEDWKYLTQ
jgi:hypothetical protein